MGLSRARCMLREHLASVNHHEIQLHPKKTEEGGKGNRLIQHDREIETTTQADLTTSNGWFATARKLPGQLWVGSRDNLIPFSRITLFFYLTRSVNEMGSSLSHCKTGWSLRQHDKPMPVSSQVESSHIHGKIEPAHINRCQLEEQGCDVILTAKMGSRRCDPIIEPLSKLINNLTYNQH